MRTIKLTIEYDGTNYCGWQRQPRGVSLQETIEQALRTMTDEEVNLVGASRTDAGVHALGQVAHVTTAASIPCDGVLRGLNSMLPLDIRIIAAGDAREGFHARKDARGKHYRYVLHEGRVASALNRVRAWHCREKLDLVAMKKAAFYCVGTHDFSAFKASGSSVKNSVRTVRALMLTRMKVRAHAHMLIPSTLSGIAIDIEGDGFLRHMVRNIVGTLVEIGRGRVSADEMPRIIAGKKREAAGVCAPPHGLHLMQIYY
jgi:tRNA pseudouridine38-40 synthase